MLVALFLCCAYAACLYGQVPDNVPDTKKAEKIRFSFEASPIYAPKTQVSGGGNVTLTKYMVEIKASGYTGEKIRAGLGLHYEFENYNFTPLTGFAVSDPWNKIHVLGLGGSVVYILNPKWSLFASPAIRYSGEEGADFGKSIMFGGSAGAVYTINSSFRIGLAAGVFYRLEETAAFPGIIVDWKISDRLRLRNPYRMRPAGPAGIELGYELGHDWNIALGGGYRSSRFRLSRSGTVSGGIGQTNAIIGYLNLTRRFGNSFNASAYCGAAFSGALRLENSSGEKIDGAGYKTAPIIGLILATSF